MPRTFEFSKFLYDCALRFLEIFADSCDDKLRELYLNEFSWDTTKFPSQFWEKLGPNLEKLSVQLDADVGIGEMEKIERDCRKLKWLDRNNSFRLILEDATEIAHRDLLISYGAQLSYALLPAVRGYSMKLITEACPNARIKLDFSCSTQVEMLEAS